jgi:hypothetical protein
MIPSSIALVLLTTQKAPPIIRTKAMMPACWENPSYKAENICHVCGFAPEMNHVDIAHIAITEKIIT